MRILFIHNAYRHYGGEDAVVAAEMQLLTVAGHHVLKYFRDNRDIRLNGFISQARLAAHSTWAWDSYRELLALIAEQHPDIVHIHNTLPLISPAAYHACRVAGIPVVQTLHNYRLLCPSGTFYRDGGVCEECVQNSLWCGVRYGCYRGSRTATATVAAMLAFHRQKRTWSEAVNQYVALTEFARAKFVKSGLPATRICVKPNFVAPDPGQRTDGGEYLLFVGRLSPEKGLHCLLGAWSRLGGRMPLRIVGDGPMADELRADAKSTGVCLDGWLPPNQTLAAMKGARCLVFPSEWYECFPVTLAEAFACGVPVIASRLGAMGEIVEHGRTGLHFSPGDIEDLAAKLDWAWTHPKEMQEMGRAARAEYLSKYTAERNYKILTDIYEMVVNNHKLDK